MFLGFVHGRHCNKIYQKPSNHEIKKKEKIEKIYWKIRRRLFPVSGK